MSLKTAYEEEDEADDEEEDAAEEAERKAAAIRKAAGTPKPLDQVFLASSQLPVLDPGLHCHVAARCCAPSARCEHACAAYTNITFTFFQPPAYTEVAKCSRV